MCSLLGLNITELNTKYFCYLVNIQISTSSINIELLALNKANVRINK